MVQEKLASLSMKVFGNSLGLKTNFPYWIHHGICRLGSAFSVKKIDSAYIEKAEELKKTGFVKLGKIDVSDLAGEIDDYFSKNPCVDGVGFVERDFSRKYAPKLFSLLQNPIFQSLYAYYGSYFQNYWITVMRYEHTGVQKAASSFDFHLDDNPRELLKIFIYLNDTKRDNGAFRTFNYRTTADLIRRGFVSCTPELRTKSQSLIDSKFVEDNLNILEGDAGTVLIFDNNLIHKGTVPAAGYRNIICIEIYPSRHPVTMDSIEKGLGRKFEVDYPPNPFFNDMVV